MGISVLCHFLQADFCIGSSGCGQAPCESVSLLLRCFLLGNPCGCPTSPSHGLAPVEASSAILPPSRRRLFSFFIFVRLKPHFKEICRCESFSAAPVVCIHCRASCLPKLGTWIAD